MKPPFGREYDVVFSKHLKQIQVEWWFEDLKGERYTHKNGHEAGDQHLV